MKERKNVTWEYKVMNTRQLSIDQLYQRKLDPKKINRIVKNYDPCLVNLVKVSFRDGRYWVFDGQNTVAAEKTVRGKGGDVTVMCKIFYGLTRLDEMELFVAQNGESSAVSINDKLRALYDVGGDPDVTGMVRGAESVGVRVDFTKGHAYNKVTALSTLLKSYMKLSRDQYIDMLSTIKMAWQGIPEGYSREILNAMTTIYLNYYGEFKSREMAKSLSKVSPIQIIREGKSYGASNTSVAYAKIILRVYNKNRTTFRLEDTL